MTSKTSMEVAADDVIELFGEDISRVVSTWKLANTVGEIRTVELLIYADDNLKINGRTVREMLHGGAT